MSENEKEEFVFKIAVLGVRGLEKLRLLINLLVKSSKSTTNPHWVPALSPKIFL